MRREKKCAGPERMKRTRRGEERERERERKNETNEKKEQFETVRKTSRCAYLSADDDVIRPNQGTLNITARYADFGGMLLFCLSRRILPHRYLRRQTQRTIVLDTISRVTFINGICGFYY